MSMYMNVELKGTASYFFFLCRSFVNKFCRIKYKKPAYITVSNVGLVTSIQEYIDTLYVIGAKKIL